MTLRLDLAVNPIPHPRPRFVFSSKPGRRMHAVNPDQLDQFKTEFGWAAKAAGAHRPLAGPLRLHELRLWRRCRGSARGDIDNMIKSVFDAGNGICWDDDSQFIQIGNVTLEAWGPTVEGRIILEVMQLTSSTEEPMTDP